MSGDFVVEKGTFRDFMELVGYNTHLLGRRPELRWSASGSRRLIGLVANRNGLKASRRNVAHHYDLSGVLYRLFLDEDLQYSCAYFREPDETLEAAQVAKKQHLAAKLLLKPGQKVLDIGCGWGGLALTLAKTEDVEVLGITLSEEQLAVARRRARDEGLDHRVRFELIDYRAARPGASTGSSRSACSNMSDRATTRLFMPRSSGCSPLPASPSCIRSARCTGRRRRVPGS